MKKVLVFLVAAVLLTGCTDVSPELERGMTLRTKLLKAEQVTFRAEVSADYGDSIQLFSADCSADAQGDLTFTLTAPETLAGITGTVSQGSGALTFGETALHFDLLTDDQLNPASAPWILLKTLRSGYLTAAGMEGDRLRLTIDDSYEDDALQLDIWLNGEDLPETCEICYDGRTILTLHVTDFRIL